jgi:DNA topoisomerase-2
MIEKSITEFLSNDYKEFAMYVVEGRAIPSVIDGFKPSQRKIIHGSSLVWKTGTEKPLKVFQLSGFIANKCFYHHGSTSLDNGIITMAQKFKNNAPLLDELGQYGSLRSPQPGAPRYIGTKLNNNFKLLYKDYELLEFKEEEGESIEPNFFLPIIPTILINGSSGIAVGFAMNILNRDVKSVTEACIKVLSDKKIGEIKPSLNEFTGDFIQDTENHKRWIIRGKFQRVNTSTVRITELPPSMTYEKYEEILDKLCDNKDIVSYDDNCKDNIDYTIKFTRADLEKYDDEKLIKLLKLEESSTEIFSTLDEFGKLKIFETSSEIVEYFVNFRLTYYHKRKKFMLDKMQHELKILSNRGRFIKAILDEKLKVNGVSKSIIIEGIEEMGLEKIDDSYDYLLRMPIYSLTKELFEKLKEDFTAKKSDIKTLEETDPKDMYLEDLNELKKKFK